MPKTVQTDLICPDCGNTFTIMRKENKQKKEFHKKWLYCPSCKKETDHIEVRNMDILLKRIEFKDKTERTAEEAKILKLVNKRKEQ